jgi:tRNA threonylcarbamoyl adenosine modification protein YeaZ
MILAIETSTPQAGLCLMDEGKPVWNKDFVTDRSHNSKIFEPLSAALIFCDRKLDLIAVGIGPGSYSGVRVGIAVANGLSLALDVPVLGISSLEAYDREYPDYLVVGDARRKSFFVASIVNGELDGEPDLVDRETFGERMSLAQDQSVFTTDQVILDEYPKIEHRYPTAENVAFRATNRVYDESLAGQLKPIEPHYLRPPYITKAKKKPVPGFPK